MPQQGPDSFEKESHKDGNRSSDDSGKLRNDVSKSDHADLQDKVREIRRQKQFSGAVTTGTFNFGSCSIDFGPSDKQRQSKSYKITDLNLFKSAVASTGSEARQENKDASRDIPQPKPIPPRPVEQSHPQPIMPGAEMPRPQPIAPRPVEISHPQPIAPRPLEISHPQPVAPAAELPQPRPIAPRPVEISHPQPIAPSEISQPRPVPHPAPESVHAKAPSTESIRPQEITQIQPLIPKPYEISVKHEVPPLPTLSAERHNNAVNAATAAIDRVAAGAIEIPHFNARKVEPVLPVIRPRVLTVPELQPQPASSLIQQENREFKPRESSRKNFVSPNPVPVEVHTEKTSAGPAPVPIDMHINRPAHTEAPVPQRAKSEGPAPVLIKPSIPDSAAQASADNHSAASPRTETGARSNFNKNDSQPAQTNQAHDATSAPKSTFLQGGTKMDVHNQPQHSEPGTVDYSTYKPQMIPAQNFNLGASDKHYDLRANAQRDQHQVPIQARTEQHMEAQYALAGGGILPNGRAWNMNPNDNGVIPVRPNAPEGTPISLTCTSDGRPIHGRLGADLGNGRRELHIDGYTVELDTIQSRH